MGRNTSQPARVRGHALVWGGAAFDARQRHIWPEADFKAVVGRALCECGAMSRELTGNKARREWHRNHKAIMLEAR